MSAAPPHDPSRAHRGRPVCPKCGAPRWHPVECPYCGVVFAKLGRAGRGSALGGQPSTRPARAETRRNRLRLALAGILAVGALTFAAVQIFDSLGERGDVNEAPAGFWGPSETCHVDAPVDGQIRTVPVDSIGDLLEQRRGCLVLLEIYASWCPDCRRAFPIVSEMASRYREYGMRVVALSTDEDLARLRSFLATQTVNFPLLWVPPSEPGDLTAALATIGARFDQGIPFFALLDPDGRPLPSVTAGSSLVDVNDAIIAYMRGRH